MSLDSENGDQFCKGNLVNKHSIKVLVRPSRDWFWDPVAQAGARTQVPKNPTHPPPGCISGDLKPEPIANACNFLIVIVYTDFYI